MTGFVPSTALFGGRQSQPHVAACRRVVPHNAAAIPFFASSAFGSPVPARIRPPLPVAPVEPDTSHESAAPFVLPRMEVTIIVGENEPVESALRRFKKDVAKSGHLFELRRRRYFETNTEKRLRKAAASRRKAKLVRAMNRNKAK